ncbi:MAG: hypothetical protein PF495_06185, partial [Spirochaetales bacterium]|nr:hypothetical protein [Spirochaetales bacterium]
MRKIFADAITAALNRIGFPWSTPRQPVASTDAMFAETVTDNDLREMFRRNQAAHAIVADVAFDALTSFTCLTPKGDPTEKFNAEAHQIYDTFIAQPLRRALVLSRLYGFCGLLVGYDDDARFSAPYTLKSKSKISYLQSIPKPWVSEIDLVKDKAGTLMLPPEVESYDLKTLSERKIHASRLIHLYNPDVDEENM